MNTVTSLPLAEADIASLLGDRLKTYPLASKVAHIWANISTSSASKPVQVSVLTKQFDSLHGQGETLDEAVEAVERLLTAQPKIAELYAKIDALKSGKEVVA